ncbi:elastase-1-like [Thalassophryne amazonica]|uniref:elastase-1-like n=1 Tax=Thalassophryne amazonica TaxID=390379 RepID=UPI00147188DF|nr:elastase-1-like [Thalassophryne amazonica]
MAPDLSNILAGRLTLVQLVVADLVASHICKQSSTPVQVNISAQSSTPFSFIDAPPLPATPSLATCSAYACVLAELEPKPSYTEDTFEVIGCEVASANAWPWQVSLQYKSGGTFYHTCGGTLVRKGWVMTAAHCVHSSRTWQVVLGDHDLYSHSGREQFKKVSRVIIHPRWNPIDVYNGYDIALLQLDSEATLNSYVQLATLPPSGQILPNNYPCYQTGWSRLSPGGSLNSKLMQAFLLLVDHQTCTRPDWWGSNVKATMVCAGGPVDCKCANDSGAPLTCQVNGQYYAYGISCLMPFSSCNILTKPRLFTRVSAYIQWMDSIMN